MIICLCLMGIDKVHASVPLVQLDCVADARTSETRSCVSVRSGLGRRCIIGDLVTIEGSYLWDDVQVLGSVCV